MIINMKPSSNRDDTNLSYRMTITLYTQPGCQPCRMTKRQLEKLNLSYQDVDVSENPEAVDTVRSLGYSSLPVITVEVSNQVDHWSGYQPHKLATLTQASA